MKRYLTALLMVLMGSAVTAQTTEPTDVEILELEFKTACSTNGTAMVGSIIKNFGEDPLFTGQGSTIIVIAAQQSELTMTGTVAVTVNQVTGTFGIFIIYPDGSACELISGTNFEPYVEQ